MRLSSHLHFVAIVIAQNLLTARNSRFLLCFVALFWKAKMKTIDLYKFLRKSVTSNNLKNHERQFSHDLV